MTDDLDQDLRDLLAQRAATITVDPAAGEQAIAARLETGDHALAEVVPLADHSRRRGAWLAVAAAAVVALVAGVAVLRDDAPVETGPLNPSTTATTPATTPAVDPLVARGEETAKDVAERVARTVFPSDEYVTTSVQDAPSPPSSPGTGLVTMEGTDGNTLLAYVVPSSSGRLRVSLLTSPDLDGHLITHMTNDELFSVELPADGHLVMRGLADDLSSLGEVEADVVDHNADVTADWWRTAPLAAYELVTADGTVLRALQPTPSTAG